MRLQIPRSGLLAISLGLLALTACQSGPRATQLPDRIPVASTGKALAGTGWELVEIQSMDDAQPNIKPADPTAYTLDLASDGTAAFKLDCNRGTGSWKAVDARNKRSGTLEFTPIAATRALCPPGSLGERIARDMGYVRSFILKDGMLHLSLMADGGIYSWRPRRGR